MQEIVDVCIVGASGISSTHLMHLKDIPSVRVAAVVDPNIERAKALAARWRIPEAYRSAGDLFSQTRCEVAHILTPPENHKDVALTYIEAGMHVFVEKPVCLNQSEASELREAAKSRGVLVGVNQQSVYFPTHVRLRNLLESRAIGKPRHIYFQFCSDMNLRTTNNFDHWMFRAPQNAFFEQAVHPLAQIYDLAGPMLDCRVLTSTPREMAPGVQFIDTWQASMACEQTTAQLLYAIGGECPIIEMIVVCEGGVARVDALRNRVVVTTESPARYLVPFRTGLDTARQIGRQSFRSLVDEIGTRIGRGRISDAIQLAWRGSISGFYEGLRAGKLPLDLEFGAEIVRMCERITEDVAIPSCTSPRPVAADLASRRPGDVAVLGGSGFLGRHVVRRLLDAGLRVDVMARNTRSLPALFHEEGVQVFHGDVSRPEDVDRVIKGARYVVDLAFSFGDETWEFMDRVAIGGARNVAESCLRHRVERLVYASTIAALYLGRRGDVITGATRTDPKPEARGHYSRAKGACEADLLEAHASRGLPVCILRPGIVVGEGGTPYHGGVALFLNKQHALGKNAGNNPLPFVLAGDCADAFYLATQAPEALGKCYNLVGDVRLTAREYMDELSRAFERPISFRPRSPQILKTIDTLKWIGQRAGGKHEPFPSFRSIQSAAVYAQFDTADIKRDLGWAPVSERREFIRRGIEVHKHVR